MSLNTRSYTGCDDELHTGLVRETAARLEENMEDHITNGTPAKRSKSEEPTFGNDPAWRQDLGLVNKLQTPRQIQNPGELSREGTGQRQPTADPDKSKLIQQQLVLLLHAHKCQRREMTNGEQACGLPYCRNMKNVLNHMTTCTRGKSCDVAHCVSSRQIITHWKNCIRTDCPVCLPLKDASDRTKTGQVMPQNPSMPVAPNQPSNVTDATMRRAYESLGLKPTSVNTSMMSGPAPGPSQPASQMPAPPSNNQLPQMMPNAVPSPNPMVKQNHLNVGNQDLTVQPTTRKDWHAQVPQHLRIHLVHKVVQAIFPCPDQEALRDSRMKNLVAYARKVEGDMYETANDKGEYFHLLAEKIYTIQRELEQKRIERLQQRLAARAMRPPRRSHYDFAAGA
ncbi:histone acetyltransferase p300-like isoform X3 [Littorina saxatilis]|uniref:histone acetyltransferase p300-like isoform X3 n=1 Tax=Littorina saxatilis TaxID=31220 RepID=UPI0038B647EA